MLKAIIADDEAHICRLIQVLADWKSMDMEVVGLAANGMEALELIGRELPDIVITDIRMPGCDGLELIRRARELVPSIEFIIISGYAHFEYAQTAIQYGVAEYLLKPIKKEELTRTLQKIRLRCLTRRSSAAEATQQRQQAQDDAERLRVGLIRDLLRQENFRPDEALLRKNYRVELAGECVVFLLQLDYDIQQFSEQAVAAVRAKSAEQLRHRLQGICTELVFSFCGTEGCGVCGLAPGALAALRQALREELDRFVAERTLYGPVDFTISMAQAESAQALPAALLRARAALAERLLEGPNRYLERVPSPSGLAGLGLLEEYRREMLQAIALTDLARARQAAQQMQHRAALPGVNGQELLALVSAAGSWFISSVEMSGKDRMQQEFRMECCLCAGVERLFKLLCETQDTLLSVLERRRKNEASRPVRLAQQYIQKHSADPLTLEQVSAQAGFSPSYFSTVFKREAGQGFNEYLAAVRLEHAKDLLRESHLPVAEVCRAVGYNDIKHFTRLFSHATGLTPGEFRKLYG